MKKAPNPEARGLPAVTNAVRFLIEGAARAGSWHGANDDQVLRGLRHPIRVCRSCDSPSTAERADLYVGDAGEHLTFDVGGRGQLICHHLLVGSPSQLRLRMPTQSSKRAQARIGCSARAEAANESYRIRREEDTSEPAAPPSGTLCMLVLTPFSFDGDSKDTATWPVESTRGWRGCQSSTVHAVGSGNGREISAALHPSRREKRVRSRPVRMTTVMGCMASRPAHRRATVSPGTSSTVTAAIRRPQRTPRPVTSATPFLGILLVLWPTRPSRLAADTHVRISRQETRPAKADLPESSGMSLRR
jgi:hypothetical protein